MRTKKGIRGKKKVMRRRRRRRSEDLFLDELGEEAFGLDGGDIAAVVAPNEDAAFDVE